jgi:hypothetical protein
VKRLALLLCAACSGAPLPNDFQKAQAREAARDDEGALVAYRAIRSDCQRSLTSSGRRRAHDDCGLAAEREAEMLERLERYDEAYAAWRAVPVLSTEGRRTARALVRAAQLAAERRHDDDAALRFSWEAVERFPDEVPADDALKIAVRIEKARDPRRLLARLDALWQRDRNLDLGDNLLYERAEVTRELDAAAAVGVYDRLADVYPHSGLRDDSLWRAAEILRASGDARGALKRLQRILDTHKDALITGSYNSLVLDDAQLLAGRIWLDDLHDPEQAARAFELLADDFKDSTLRDDALFELSRARIAQKDPRAACAALERLFREYPNGNMVRRARAQAAELQCRP